MKRIKLTAPALKTRADVEAILNEIALTTINRNKALLAMDQQITAIRERHEATINQCNTALEQKTELIRAWAEAHPEEFGKAKSLDLFHALIGWRTGQPTLKTLKGWTWDAVLEAVRNLGFQKYIRTKEELNKQAMLAERDLFTEDGLRQLGLRLAQQESFFVEPKLTSLETKQAA